MAYAISVFTEWSDRHLFVDDGELNESKVIDWLGRIDQGNPDLVYLENVKSTSDDETKEKVEKLFNWYCYGE